MCELLGFTAKNKKDIRSTLRLFVTHSCRHPHGWGLMREHDGVREWIKEPVRADRSALLEGILSETQPQTIALAHIRLATVGNIRTENTHPYYGTDASGRIWTLIHNGTIYSSNRLTPYYAQQEGNTDSERVFLYLLHEMNAAIAGKGSALTPEERFAVTERTAISLSARNKLNLMIYDGELLYVHKNMDGTLYELQQDGGRLFSTTPLGEGAWQSYPTAQLNAYRDGAQVFEGVRHGRIFVPNLEYITAAAALNI